MDIHGKRALVTGASRGIGAATAIALGAVGCRVALAARATAATSSGGAGTLEGTLDAIQRAGGSGLIVPANLSVASDASTMVHTAAEAFGGLDIVVNNAGVMFTGDLDIAPRKFEVSVAVNVLAPLIAMREAASVMGPGGSIVNVSSLAAVLPQPGILSYGVAKAALERLSVDAAGLLAPEGIAVRCLRIDLPVASDGMLTNLPDADTTTWESCDVAADAILWLLRQPLDGCPAIVSMYELKRDGDISSSLPLAPPCSAPPSALRTARSADGTT